MQWWLVVVRDMLRHGVGKQHFEVKVPNAMEHKMLLGPSLDRVCGLVSQTFADASQTVVSSVASLHPRAPAAIGQFLHTACS